MEKSEINEKKYYNTNLDLVLRKYITREKYGDFAIILQDIFQRRAYEFDFSEEHIADEVANFVNRVETVEFASKDDMIFERAMGVYIPGEKSIRLSQDYYLQDIKSKTELEFGTKLFETLTHEVYHGIADRGEYNGLVYSRVGETFSRGTALNEVFTETAANRACFPRGSKEAEQYRSDTDGYPDITFVSNLLAASVGLTEKEILRTGIQNRGKLMEAISSKFPKEKSFDEAYKMIEKIEGSLDIIYNVRYSNKEKTETEKDLEAQLMGSSLVTLYETAFKLASYQIENDDKPINQETLADATYRYSKLEKIMQDSLTTFKNYNAIPFDYEQRILNSVEKSQNSLANRVAGFDAIVKQGYRITNPKDLKITTDLAKKGMLQKKAKVLNKKYGIIVPEGTSETVSSLTDDMEYEAYVMKEDFDNGEQWDNSDVAVVIKRRFVEEMERKGLIRKPTEAELADTEELPVVKEDINKTEELPVVDELDKTEEIPLVDEDKKNKGLLGKLKDSINIIVTRFKNRNQQKLNPGQGNIAREDDNSEYYASLATKTVEKEDPFSKYIVKPKAPSLKLEEINFSDDKSKENKDREDDAR
jgi:hypothetical protein